MKSVAFHLNTLCHGGAERVVSNLANQFAAEGYTVYVATEWYSEEEFPLDPRVIRVHVGLREQDEHKGRITKFLLRIRYLKEFMMQYHPDVLCAFAHKALFRALMAEKGTGVPVVVCVRIDPVGNYESLRDKIQIRWLLPKAAGAVFQTEDQRRFFKPYLQDNSTIIVNPVAPKYLNVPKPAHRDKSVVHSARLADFKNQAMLCRAFVKVHERHPDYVLKIYGPDSEDGTLQILQKIIKENNAGDWILLMGGSDSLEQQLPHGAVYAYSSDYEGMPNSLIEAMCLGLPCVSTDCPCGGPAMLIQNEVNGLLVPVGDENAMADAICRLIEDRPFAERLGDNARKIGEIVSVDNIYRQWRDYLEKVTRGDFRH